MLRKALALGDVQAQAAMGQQLFAQDRFADALQQVYLQARRLHRVEGVPAKYTEAIRLYWLADRLGHREARKMLSLIYSRPQTSGEVDIGWMRQLADMDLTLPSPRLGQPSHALVLHEDITPLMDWLPAAWRL